ncbi:hypothetical protein CAPTEDRAFT_194984 [Capitella teleta]|uniref:Uncharacterized protein n=1 Tax=Capitella teleta TaxID=283909 RepID=R7VLR9_CAPTE|nr:hypothetical protein CAPTEDRAFT_194984 [Capitella teleta]|eukprot:ELU17845.1 hypothetical protein CAPTEDRAFT_194984 [Capitella teleta]
MITGNLWHTDEVHEARRKSRKCERAYRKSHLKVHKQILRNQRNEVVRLINNAKASYYLKSLMDADCKVTFQIISGLLGKGNASNHTLMEVKQQAVSVDGLQVFKSKTSQFWPVQCMVSSVDERYPFLVGLFYGESQPSDLECMDGFINEFIELEQIKPHMGFYSCKRCHLKGAHDGRLYFPVDQESHERPDEGYRYMVDSEHHIAPTSLLRFTTGLVSKFSMNYMHMVCMEVVRKLIAF